MHNILKIFKQVFAITTDNASNNKTMVASLEKIMNENGLIFSMHHHVQCMAHVLNLVIQGGLKKVDNSSLTSEYSKGEDDERCDEDVLEVSSKQKRLEKFFIGSENLFFWRIIYLK